MQTLCNPLFATEVLASVLNSTIEIKEAPRETQIEIIAMTNKKQWLGILSVKFKRRLTNRNNAKTN